MFLSPSQQINVINKLHSLATLPSSGCIAGQGLASIIYDELEIGVNAPINDLDIFDISSVRLYKALADCPNRVSLSFKGINDQVSIIDDHYNQISFYSVRTQRGYRVVKSFTDKEQPIINKTLITFSDQSIKLIDQAFDHDTLLESFDFNACQIAYDLGAKTFHYTNAFEVFLKTKILKLASLHTPLHSAVRLFKKLKEIAGVNCNVEAEMNMITTYLSMHSVLSTTAIPPMGKRYYELYKKYESDITPYFQIETNERYANYKHPDLYSLNSTSLNQNKTISGFHSGLISGVNFPAYYELIAGAYPSTEETTLIQALNNKCLESRNDRDGVYDTYGHAFFLIKLLSINNVAKDEYTLNGDSGYQDGEYTIYSKALLPYIEYVKDNILLGTALAPASFQDSISIIDTIERLGNNGQWIKFLINNKYLTPQSLAPYTDEHVLDLIASFKQSALQKQNSKPTVVEDLTTSAASYRGITNLYDYLTFCFSRGKSCRFFIQGDQLYIAKSAITNNEYLVRVYDIYHPLKKYKYFTSCYLGFSADKEIVKTLLIEIHRRTRVKRCLWNLCIRPFVKIKLNKKNKLLECQGGLDTEIPF